MRHFLNKRFLFYQIYLEQLKPSYFKQMSKLKTISFSEEKFIEKYNFFYKNILNF